MNSATRNHLKTTAMSICSNTFKLNSLKLGRMERMSFSDLLNYKLKRDRVLRFTEFNKICGISRLQWDVFRLENKENKGITWIVE